MPRLPSQWLLRLLGGITVSAILGFLLLPALVVTLAAFNSRAILSFPPESWSWRWFAKAIAYEDFQAGFHNGLIVTGWASTIALVVGVRTRARALRVPFQAGARDRAALSAGGAPLHGRPRLSHPRGTARHGARLCGDRRLPRRTRAAVRAAERLHLAAQPRSATGARRREPRRTAPSRSHHRHVAVAASGPGRRVVVRGDPVVQRIYRFAVRHRPAHANTAGCALQLRARIRRPLDGCDLGHVHCGHRNAADAGQRLPWPGKGAER